MKTIIALMIGFGILYLLNDYSPSYSTVGDGWAKVLAGCTFGYGCGSIGRDIVSAAKILLT